MLEDHREVAPLVFYRRLFELDPQIRILFKADIAEESRVFMDRIGALITRLDRPDVLAAEVRELGAGLGADGVTDGHHAAVKQALVDMLSQTLGAAFTPDARQAWEVLCGKVEAALKQGARTSDLSPV